MGSDLLQTVTYADSDGDGQPDGSFTFAYHPDQRLSTVTDGAGKILETTYQRLGHRNEDF